MEDKNFAFDPDFSEYNPVFAELKSPKEHFSLIKAIFNFLTTPIVVQTE